MNDIFSHHSFHFIGIQGVGMTALALILSDMGKFITGSDVAESFMTGEVLKERSIQVFSGYSAEHLGTAEVIVYTGAVGKGNIELDAARLAGKKIVSLAEAVAELSKLKKTISICGSHGKTTTTSLFSHVGQGCGLDMSYYVGAAGFGTSLPGRWGKGEYFAIESDEYVVDPVSDRRAKLLLLYPSYIVCTNIDFDHPDIYTSIEEIENVYKTFFSKLAPEGMLLVNGDDKRLRQVAYDVGKKNTYTYGIGRDNDFVIAGIESNGTHTTFELYYKHDLIGSFSLSLSGVHNVMNASAVVVFYYLQGVDVGHIQEALETFSGAKRRMEYVTTVKKYYLYDDYAHHPAEIKATIEAFRDRYPSVPVVLLFHPHTYTRTKALENEFVEALSAADSVGLLPIFASAREKSGEIDVSSQKIIEKAAKNGVSTITLLEQESDWREYLQKIASQYSEAVLVTMGAGDVYKYQELIKNTLEEV